MCDSLEKVYAHLDAQIRGDATLASDRLQAAVAIDETVILLTLSLHPY